MLSLFSKYPGEILWIKAIKIKTIPSHSKVKEAISLRIAAWWDESGLRRIGVIKIGHLQDLEQEYGEVFLHMFSITAIKSMFSFPVLDLANLWWSHCLLINHYENSFVILPGCGWILLPGDLIEGCSLTTCLHQSPPLIAEDYIRQSSAVKARAQGWMSCRSLHVAVVEFFVLVVSAAVLLIRNGSLGF